MTLQDFNSKRTQVGIEGTGITAFTKREITWTDKLTKQPTFTIPIHAHVILEFSPKSNPGFVYITYNNEVKISKLVNGHKNFTGISNPPSIKTLEKWSNDGIARSVTGKKVEMDGYGPDGSPSWGLVLGII